MRYIIILTFISSFYSLSAQQMPVDSIYEKQYQERIKKEKLDGIYIPKDLFDAFDELNGKTDEEGLEKFKAMPEDIAKTKLMKSLGRWLMKNWSLYQGSRFSEYLSAFGVSNPEHQAQFIIITWHRKINGKALGIKELAEQYKKTQQEAVAEKRKVLDEYKRKRENEK